ncbi:hypothetical protein FRC03_010454 [Tulasnella sp. 419]|nr:hypothetical protein FRC03_010454 [Tulasnella sp. 419]
MSQHLPATTTSPRQGRHKPSREPPPPYTDPNPTLIVDERTPLILVPATTGFPEERVNRSRRAASNATTTSSYIQQPLSPTAGTNHVLEFSTSTIASDLPVATRVERYFDPLKDQDCWMALLHLGVINFPFALVAWVYLFVATLVGTTLLLTLPFGVLIWWANLRGARAFTRWELILQSKFHKIADGAHLQRVPYVYQPFHPSPEHQSYMYSHSPLITPAHLESATSEIGDSTSAPPPAYEGSFLQNTYAMFLDPSSYQPLFYFLVIKATTTLLLTPLVLAFAPVSLALVFPAPFMLRTVKRMGKWQADLAMEGLQWFVQY